MAATTEEAERAAMLLGMADAAATATGRVLDSFEATLQATTAASLAAVLGADAFSERRAAGQATSMDRIEAYVLEGAKAAEPVATE